MVIFHYNHDPGADQGLQLKHLRCFIPSAGIHHGPCYIASSGGYRGSIHRILSGHGEQVLSQNLACIGYGGGLDVDRSWSSIVLFM